MKYEIQKLKRSRFIQCVVFCVFVLFFLNLIFQTNTIRESAMQDPDALLAYKEDLQEESDSVDSSLLFQADESTSLILEAKNASYQKINVPHEIKNTYRLCFDNSFDVILVSFVSVFLFYQLVVYEKEEGYYEYFNLYYTNKKNYKLKQFLLCFALTFLLYLIFLMIRMIVGIALFGYQDIFSSVQCVNGMLYCPYAINIICALLLSSLYALIYLLMIAFACFVLSDKVNDIKVLIVIVLTVSMISYFLEKIPFQSYLVIFKLMTWNTLYMHLDEFHGILLFSHVWMSHAITLLWYGILMLFCFILYKIHFTIRFPLRKKKKQEHSLLQLEIMKLCKPGMLAILALLIISCVMFCQNQTYVSLDDYYANYYLNALEGKKTEEKEQYINEQQDTFQKLNEESTLFNTEMDSTSQTRMYEIKAQLNREKGFLIAISEYENSHDYFINTYLIKQILTKQDVLFYILIQFILLVIIFQQVISFDRKNHIDTLLHSIPEYQMKSEKMDRMILLIIASFVTITTLIRLIYLSDPLINSTSPVLKISVIILFFILLLCIENILIRAVISIKTFDGFLYRNKELHNRSLE